MSYLHILIFISQNSNKQRNKTKIYKTFSDANPKQSKSFPPFFCLFLKLQENANKAQKRCNKFMDSFQEISEETKDGMVSLW